MKKLFGITALAMVALSAEQAQAADVIPGYDISRQPALSVMPSYLLAEQTGVRPQVPYDRRPYGVDEPGNSTMLMPAGVGVVPALLSVAIIHGTELAAAKRSARTRWQWLQAGQCQIDAKATFEPILERAMQQAAITAAPSRGVLEERDLGELVEISKPRHVVRYGTSFNPDLDLLLTTVTVSGWDSGSVRGSVAPDWKNVLLVASTPLNMLAKTDGDTEVLARAQMLAYQASGNDERIRKINAAGHGADRRLRTLANDTLRLHKSYMRQVTQEKWTPDTEAARRAQYWIDDECALLRQAMADNADEAGRLLQALYEGQLPVEMEKGVPAPSRLALAALPEGLQYPNDAARQVDMVAANVHLSHVAGTSVSTAYAYRVLNAEDGDD